MIVLTILALFLANTLALSGSAAASYCHCDLTTSFCDVGCCCDSDCSGVSNNPHIDHSCQLLQSQEQLILPRSHLLLAARNNIPQLAGLLLLQFHRYHHRLGFPCLSTSRTDTQPTTDSQSNFSKHLIS